MSMIDVKQVIYGSLMSLLGYPAERAIAGL